MKILFVGYHNPHFISLCESIERAIKELGHELYSFDYRQWMIPGRLREKFFFLQQWDLKRINSELIKAVERFQPQLLLVNGGWTIFPQTIIEIKKRWKLKTANWISDFPLKFNDYLASGPHYDAFFASGTDALMRYQQAGHRNGYWLPFACDPSIHQKLNLSKDEQKQWGSDVCFVGSCYPERIEILNHLLDFDLKIWGLGWKKLPAKAPLRPFIKGQSVNLYDWLKIYAGTKVVLNIIGDQCGVPEPYIPPEDFRMTNTKVFEILGCGALQLVDRKADAQSLFEDQKHLAFYDDGKDLVLKVQHYLEHPQQRVQIAAFGQQEVLARHTYPQRIKEILSRLSL